MWLSLKWGLLHPLLQEQNCNGAILVISTVTSSISSSGFIISLSAARCSLCLFCFLLLVLQVNTLSWSRPDAILSRRIASVSSSCNSDSSCCSLMNFSYSSCCRCSVASCSKAYCLRSFFVSFLSGSPDIVVVSVVVVVVVKLILWFSIFMLYYLKQLIYY